MMRLLILAAALLCGACATHPTDKAAAQRQDFLERFARGYYPGRSGQIFLVPREGSFITVRDPKYAFTHGTPWPYDSRIPVLFSGAPFIRQGQFDLPTTQQDIVPTLAALLGVPLPATVTGHAQPQVLRAGSARPKIIALFVMDAMRAEYFDRYAEVMPTLTRLRREGAWFSKAAINYLPTVTSVGHATIGTGTDPRFHGLAANTVFNVITGKTQPAYDQLDPRELMSLTLADLWNIETEGRAVIVGQGGAIRAVAGLVGHGACIPNGRRVLVGSYASDGGWETGPCYQLPEVLKSSNARESWEAAGGTWMGHDIASAAKFRASSLFQRFEGDALVSVIEREALGADDITDLLLVNMKGPDYTAHAYGPDSAELRETLAELDRQMARVIAALERKAGPAQTVIAITADHGMASEPAHGHRRVYGDEVIDAINGKFDPAQKKVVRFYGDPADLQIDIDSERLISLGYSLKDVAAFLESLPYIQVAYTEDEVRAISWRSAPAPR